MKEVTFCLTSCNRWNLLQATLDSFLSLNTHPIKRYLLHEDSGNAEIVSKIKEKYPFIEVLESNRSGLLASVDKLYALVNTPYIFHSEDDWLFQGNPDFIQQSIEILSTRQDVHQVWIRYGIPNNWLESDYLDGYKMVKQSHFGDWCGFSFNCGLRRLSDYKQMFPNGYNVLNTHGTNSALNEHECNQVASSFGYRAALLNNPSCIHIGEGKSTYK
jgi:hypothetical protein